MGVISSSRYRVLYYRVHDPDYPRNRLIRQSLLESGDFEVLSMPRGGSGGLPFLVRELRNLWVGSRGADAIIVSEFGLRYAPIARMVAWYRRCILVVDGFVRLHETRVEDTQKYAEGSMTARRLWWEDWLAIRLSDLYLVDTDARAGIVRRDFAANTRVATIPVGAPDWAKPTVRPENERPRILYYGNYIPLHGIPLVVEALTEVQRHVQVDVTFIGDGRCRPEAERLAATNGIDISFVDSMPEEELARWVADCDIVIGIFGDSIKAMSVIANKVWQGLACGKVVVTQRSEGIDELTTLVDPAQLVLTDPGSVQSIAHEMTAAAQRQHYHRTDWARTAGNLDAYVTSRLVAFREGLAASIERRGRPPSLRVAPSAPARKRQ